MRLPLTPGGPRHRAPLSFAQQRLWFVDRLERQSAEYHIQEAWRLHGPLDAAALQRAITRIVQRHAALRTRFVEVDGEPFQEIDAEGSLALPIIDLSHEDEAGRAAQVRRALRRERETPFDLERGPLLRATLLRLAPHDHVLIRAVHHVVCDGWSSGLLNRELDILYAACRRGEPDPLPPLPLQYADFASWQRASVDEESLCDGVAYWTGHLAGMAERLDLPADRPRPPARTTRAGAAFVALDAERTAAVARLSRAHGATPYMTLLALFAALLARYGADDLVIGSPVANRPDPRLASLIGFFANSLALRIRVSPAASFAQLLAQVRRTVLDACRHQDVPFERVVQAVAPRRSASIPPLVQVVFAMQNAPWLAPALDGLEVERLQETEIELRSDLTVHASTRGGETELRWCYNRSLFDPWRIERMAAHYVRLLDAALCDADGPCGALEMLDDEERAQLVRAATGARGRTPSAATAGAHRGFERRAAVSPDAVAIVDGSGHVTYGLLERQANRWAHHLRALGVQPDEPVCVGLGHTIDGIVTMLAVLKAGGACLPLDPAWPQERRQRLVAGCRARLVLSSARVGGGPPAAADAPFGEGPFREIERERATVAGRSSEPVTIRIDARQRAYVLHTSGSSGAPKGVGVDHGALACYLDAIEEALPGLFTRRSAQTAAPGFSSAVRQLLGPLTHGGTVVLIGADDIIDPRGLAAVAARQQIEVLDLVPTVWRALVEAMERGPHEPLAALQALLLASEPFPADLLSRWQALVGPAALVRNLYGLTETAGIVSTDHVTGATATALAVPVGRPVPATRVHVLDAQLALSPTGVPGEIYVSGPRLAREYTSRPGLTAAAFVADPLGEPGGRMFRTGDRGCYLPDGRLTWLGRADAQIKLRGCRIEPGEIEAALLTHPSVRQAVVVIRPAAAGGEWLVAYVTAREHVPEPGLRAHLRARLPDYLIPARIVRLDRLPITPHGKLDRAALPEPGLDQRQDVEVAPPTASQAQLCEIFRDLLGVASVAVDDDFFGLGGHSLMIPRLVHAVRTRLGRAMEVRWLIDAPTARALDERLSVGDG